MQPLIVLDKSYVRAASTAEIEAACDNFCALMTEDLFFELISGDLETRTKCFQKFPCRDNPVELIPNVGTLLRFEKEARKPSSLWKRRLRSTFRFNAGLADGQFILNEKQEQAIARWRDDLAQDVDHLIALGSSADRLFPALRGLRPGQRPEVIESLIGEIAVNMEGARQLYAHLKPPEFPPSAIVGRTWAVFRRLQVYAIGAVEYFAKYGDGINKTNRDVLENERTDLNYLVVALLAGGLATGDKTIARRFRLLRTHLEARPDPRGACYQCKRALHLSNERLRSLNTSFKVPLKSIVDLPESLWGEVKPGVAHSTSP